MGGFRVRGPGFWFGFRSKALENFWEMPSKNNKGGKNIELDQNDQTIDQLSHNCEKKSQNWQTWQLFSASSKIGKARPEMTQNYQ